MLPLGTFVPYTYTLKLVLLSKEVSAFSEKSWLLGIFLFSFTYLFVLLQLISKTPTTLCSFYYYFAKLMNQFIQLIVDSTTFSIPKVLQLILYTCWLSHVYPRYYVLLYNVVVPHHCNLLRHDREKHARGANDLCWHLGAAMCSGIREGAPAIMP
jgi:hypothetical protein